MMRLVGFRRALLLVSTIAIAVFAVDAQPASAHAGSSTESTNYRTTIAAVTPRLPGVVIEVMENGDRLQLTNESEKEVVIGGYSGEPYLRVSADGVWRNRLSPATYTNEDRFGERAVPAFANAGAEPEWKRISDTNTVLWHDHRAHWMSTERPASVRAEPDRRQVVMADFAVPVSLGPTTAIVSGNVEWIPPGSPVPWLVVGLLVALIIGGIVMIGKTQALAVGLVVMIAADIVHVVGGFLAAAGTIQSRLTTFLTQDTVSVVVWFTGLWAVCSLMKNRNEIAGFVGLFTAAVLWVFGAITDLPTLWDSQVAFAGPTAVARAAVAVIAGAGASTLVLSAGLIRQSTARATLAQGGRDHSDASCDDEDSAQKHHSPSNPGSGR